MIYQSAIEKEFSRGGTHRARAVAQRRPGGAGRRGGPLPAPPLSLLPPPGARLRPPPTTFSSRPGSKWSATSAVTIPRAASTPGSSRSRITPRWTCLRRRTGESLDDREWEAGSSAAPDALSAVLAGERAAILAAAMGTLPALYREALTLRFEEGMKLEEIAEVTGAPLSTVKSRVQRGLEALRPENLQGRYLMTDHELVRPLIALSAAGLLDAEGERRLREHTAACADCRRSSKAFAQLADGLRAHAHRAGSSRGLLARTQALRGRGSRPPRRRPPGCRCCRSSPAFCCSLWRSLCARAGRYRSSWHGWPGRCIPSVLGGAAAIMLARAASLKGVPNDTRCCSPESDPDRGLGRRRDRHAAGVPADRISSCSTKNRMPVAIRSVISRS